MSLRKIQPIQFQTSTSQGLTLNISDHNLQNMLSNTEGEFYNLYTANNISLDRIVR